MKSSLQFAKMGESGKCLNTIPAHVTRPDEGLPMPIRSLKYRLYPNQAQAEWLTGQLREACDLYNAALEERKSAWKTCRKHISLYDQCRQLKDLRAQGLIGIPNFSCAKEVLRRLDRSYSGLFRRGYGFPRFKSHRRFNSVTFPEYGKGAGLCGDHLRLQGCSSVRVNLHRPIDGTIKTVTIKREGSRWFVILFCEVAVRPMPSVQAECGIDVGLTSFVALSDGSTVVAPQFFRRAQAKLRRAQRHLARCKRGSKRRGKAVARVARHHVQVCNQRSDFHHKLTRKIVNENQLIAVEDLKIKGIYILKSLNPWASVRLRQRPKNVAIQANPLRGESRLHIKPILARSDRQASNSLLACTCPFLRSRLSSNPVSSQKPKALALGDHTRQCVELDISCSKSSGFNTLMRSCRGQRRFGTESARFAKGSHLYNSQIKGLARTMLAKSIHDAGWGEFLEKLTYKAADAGRTMVRVDPRGTSQTCTCGTSVPKTLSDRWHNCPKCGLSASRDVVSAMVILQAGRACQIVTKEGSLCVI